MLDRVRERDYSHSMIVLGIESSCDETAAALVRDDRAILAEALASQLADHAPFGGVVPEIAARAHLESVDGLVSRVLAESGLALGDIDGIAATGGPGLIGGVIVGVTFAKALALVAKKPFIAVNHLEAHALTVRLTDAIDFPYVLLLVSGGHCQLLAVEGVGRYVRLGATMDDAAGEAFDKAARLLDLGFPGGPAIEKAARGGDPKRFALPRPMKGRPGCDFSFSGLKNALRLAVERMGALADQDRADLAASFQAAVAETLGERTAHGIRTFRRRHRGPATLVAAGGVAANTALRQELARTAGAEGAALIVPPPALCTDNGSMIAWAGLERLRLGLTDPLDFRPRPRWPLDDSAPALTGAGVKA